LESREEGRGDVHVPAILFLMGREDKTPEKEDGEHAGSATRE